MLSRPFRPIVKRMFAANQAELPLPVVAPAPRPTAPDGADGGPVDGDATSAAAGRRAQSSWSASTRNRCA